MIKGIFIFGAGISVGYGLALSQNEDVREAVVAFKQFLHDEALKDEVRRREEADAQAEAEGQPNTATGKSLKDFNDEAEQAASDEEEETVDAEVVDPGATPNQGETP